MNPEEEAVENAGTNPNTSTINVPSASILATNNVIQPAQEPAMESKESEEVGSPTGASPDEFTKDLAFIIREVPGPYLGLIYDFSFPSLQDERGGIEFEGNISS